MLTIKPGNAALVAFLIAIVASLYVFNQVEPQWREQAATYNVYKNDQGELVYKYKGKEQQLGEVIRYEDSPLNQANLDKNKDKPSINQQWVIKQTEQGPQYQLLSFKFHFGLWSLLPAFMTILLCLATKEPLTALLGGIVCAAFMLGRFDLVDQVFIPNMATTNAAGILILYLILLGGLMGIWSRTGAALAFAQYMTEKFVTGPRSAKFVTWFLGMIFFQGGTISTVLVGTTVKPLADKQNVSHEEMAYIVDSTASPIASVIAFNAWPAYIQAFIFVPGVAFLATEADRISFFFSSIMFSFYGIFAVIGTFLLSMNIFTFAPSLKRAHIRAKTTGALDGPDAKPMSAKELQNPTIPEGYNPHMLEFVLPLISLLVIAISTFIFFGSPDVNWAFACALLLAGVMASFKGMSLSQLLEGVSTGLKGVVTASVILVMAITIGALSKELGGGIFLVEQLGQEIPYWLLPLILQLMTMVIAFSTGTSWGTYAIAFPLAMPLAWAVAQAHGIANPEIYLAVCFATVLNGSVYGDQCSPISDTTILSSMTTGCDLMDHVKTQIVPATFAATLAAILWLLTVLVIA